MILSHISKILIILILVARPCFAIDNISDYSDESRALINENFRDLDWRMRHLYPTTLLISDTAYGATWNGVTTIAPSKNAVYDYMVTLLPSATAATTYLKLNQTTHQHVIADYPRFDAGIGIVGNQPLYWRDAPADANTTAYISYDGDFNIVSVGVGSDISLMSGSNKIGMGTGTPVSALEIYGSTPRLTITDTAAGAAANGGFQYYADGVFRGGFLWFGPSAVMSFYGPNVASAIDIDVSNNTNINAAAFAETTLTVGAATGVMQELTVNGDATISDGSPNIVFRDATDNSAYCLHYDSAVSAAPFQGFTLWRGTDTGGLNSFADNPDVPIIWADLTNNMHLYGTLAVNGGQITSTTGAISFDNENLTTTGTLTLPRLNFTDTATCIDRTSGDGWINIHADIGVEINSPIINVTDLYIAGSMSGEEIHTPSATQVIDAAVDAILADAAVVVLNPDGNYILTSTPTIANGTVGQILYIITANGEANTVTVQDQGTLAGSNLQLGAANRVIGAMDVLTLIFDGTDWLEQNYADN